MSSTETKSGYTFECDTRGPDCDEMIAPPHMGSGSDKPDFMMCFERAKEKGWRAYSAMSRDGRVKTWKHRCPSCSRA